MYVMYVCAVFEPLLHRQSAGPGRDRKGGEVPYRVKGCLLAIIKKGRCGAVVFVLECRWHIRLYVCSTTKKAGSTSSQGSSIYIYTRVVRHVVRALN